MISHFDFFTFYDTTIIVACNEKYEIMGYACLKDPNELCQVFVKPSYRNKASGLVHTLVWKVVELAKKRGQTTLWGSAYPGVKDLYISYVRRFGAELLEEVQAEDSIDGQWRGLFNIVTITSDRRP
jgi:hypothetical protein